RAAPLRSRVAAADLLRQRQRIRRAAMDLWAYTNNVILDFSRRGKPTDNASIESFNGRFRDECLNVHWFEGLEDATTQIEACRQDYKANYPHRALKGLSPNEYARLTMEPAAESL